MILKNEQNLMKVFILIIIFLNIIFFSYAQQVEIHIDKGKTITEIVATGSDEVFTKSGNFKFIDIKKIVFAEINENNENLYNILKSKLFVEVGEFSADQSDNIIFASSDPKSFADKLSNSNVKYIDYGFNKEQETALINNPQFADLFFQFSEYMKSNFGILGAIVTDNQRTEVYSNANSICEVLAVNLVLSDFQSQLMAVGYYDLTTTLQFCDKISYEFKTQLNVNGNTRNFSRPLKRGLDKVIPFKPNPNRQENLLSIESGENLIDLRDAIAYFKGDEIKAIEGVYELISKSNRMPVKQFGIKRHNDSYQIFHVANFYMDEDWDFGEIRGELSEIRTNEVFRGHILGNYKSPVEVVAILDEKGFLEIEDFTREEKFRFVKIDLKLPSTSQK